MGVCSYCKSWRLEECFGWNEAEAYCGVKRPEPKAQPSPDHHPMTPKEVEDVVGWLEGIQISGVRANYSVLGSRPIEAANEAIRQAASLLRTQAERIAELERRQSELARELSGTRRSYSSERAVNVAAQATIERYREALEAFVNVRDQYPESVKLINKTIPGFSLVAVHVTKDQFLAARSVLEGKECS